MQEEWTKFWVLAFVLGMCFLGNLFFEFEEVEKTCWASLSAKGAEEGVCTHPESAVRINEAAKSDRISAVSKVRVILAFN
jgi:hypothetical protein